MSTRGHAGPIRSLDDAARWLEGLINVEKLPEYSYERFSLAPIEALLDRIGRPERGISILHIAGSKGKGSTALFAEAVLRAAGRSVGTFTSPHLERWTERFRIDAHEVGAATLAECVERLRPHVEALRAQGAGVGPTFFDVTTAVALQLFRDARVDHVILETGLGGRLDSTNAVLPEVACITSIELEHTDRLGGTLAEIATEKAGIIKAGVPVVVGELPEEALHSIARRAADVAAPLVLLGRDLRIRSTHADLGGIRADVSDGPFEVDIRLPVVGAHQASNAALAVACVRRLLADRVGDAELAGFVRAGLARVELPARLEVVSRAPWVVIDAAHTAASARGLGAVMREIGRPTDLVLSISIGKDVGAILDALLPCARSVTLTRAEPARSLTPEEIASAVRSRAQDLPIRVVPNPHLALRAAYEALERDAALCVAGSVYLAGIARSVLRGASQPSDVAVTRRAESLR